MLLKTNRNLTPTFTSLTLAMTDNAEPVRIRADLINSVLQQGRYSKVHLDGPGEDITYAVREDVLAIDAPRCLAHFTSAQTDEIVRLDPYTIYSIKEISQNRSALQLVSSNKKYGFFGVKESIEEAERIVTAAFQQWPNTCFSL